MRIHERFKSTCAFNLMNLDSNAANIVHAIGLVLDGMAVSDSDIVIARTKILVTVTIKSLWEILTFVGGSVIHDHVSINIGNDLTKDAGAADNKRDLSEGFIGDGVMLGASDSGEMRIHMRKIRSHEIICNMVMVIGKRL